MKNPLIKSNMSVLLDPGPGNKVCNSIEAMLFERLLCAGKVESRALPSGDLLPAPCLASFLDSKILSGSVPYPGPHGGVLTATLSPAACCSPR